MSRLADGNVIVEGSFPRVSGDEPLMGRCGGALTGFSPRERG